MDLKLNPRPYTTAQSALTADGTFQPVSYWQETIDVSPAPPLEGDETCDVAIVGAGFTGLSTAIALKQAHPELHITILERGVAGHGASGRNGGFAMPLFGWDLLTTVNKLGNDKGGQVYRLMYDAVDHLRNTIDNNAIACDPEYTGYALLSTCAAREKHLQKEYALAHELGFDHTWLKGDTLDQHIHCEHYRSGIFDPKPFVINPAKLTRGLKDLATQLGITTYEQTPLIELNDDDPATLRTPHGTLVAKRVVLALNGYASALNFQSSTVLPVHSYIVLTEALTDAQLVSTGWHQHRASLETARNLIHYFRLTIDNRIAFGGDDADLYYHGTFRDHDPRICTNLETAFRKFFPTLNEVPISHRWGGTLGVTLDMFPTFGCTGDHKNIFYASGYSGHGVALANYAGQILSPAILASLGLSAPETTATPFFYNRSTLPLPPDPIRYLGMKAYATTLRLQDKIQGA